MTFEQFRSAWDAAIAGSRLPAKRAEIKIELETTDRDHDQFVEPLAGQPFPRVRVDAKVGFVWTNLHSTWTFEGDRVATEYDPTQLGDPDPPWLRIELALRARWYGEPTPVPPPDRLAAWSSDVVERFGALCKGRDGGRSWSHRPPRAVMECRGDGTLALSHVELGGIDDIQLRRLGPDDGPDPQMARTLDALFERVGRALDAWSGALAHLVPPDGRSRTVSLSNTPPV